MVVASLVRGGGCRRTLVSLRLTGEAQNSLHLRQPDLPWWETLQAQVWPSQHDQQVRLGEAFGFYLFFHHVRRESLLIVDAFPEISRQILSDTCQLSATSAP